jgi:hypothetical protein
MEMNENGYRGFPDGRLRIGDEVYVRFFGTNLLTIKRLVNASNHRSSQNCSINGKTYRIPDFPHYICLLYGKEYIVPRIHISTKSLHAETNGNRRQLRLPL